MNATIRYGVIGGGDMGREHVRNIALIDGAAVTAIADPHDPSLSAACRQGRLRVFRLPAVA